MFWNRNRISFWRGACARGDESASLHNSIKRAAIDDQIFHDGKAADAERLDCDPLAVAKEILSSVSLAGPVTDEVLHRYRIAVKRARYAAEFARRSSEATQFIARLKQVQDALGNWHDWMTLTQTAKKQLGEVSQSPLVAVLHNETRVKFRYAVAALSRNDADDKPGVSRKLGLNVQRHLAPTQAA